MGARYGMKSSINTSILATPHISYCCGLQDIIFYLSNSILFIYTSIKFTFSSHFYLYLIDPDRLDIGVVGTPYRP